MKHPSAKTSVSQIPAAYKEPKLQEVYKHSRNLDFGGGKYDLATQYLDGINCQNFVYDPYCRTQAHNIDVIRNLDFDGSISVISCLNVLNVLLDKKDRDQVVGAIKYLTDSYSSVKHVVFQVYTKDKSGVSTATQLNKGPEWYWPELAGAFAGWRSEILGAKKNIIHLWRD